MKKIILAVCLFSSLVFANNTSKDNKLDRLLKQLQTFQQKMAASKNVALNSNNEFQKINKQINLLNRQIMYIRTKNDLVKIRKNTLNNLKKITIDLYYLIKKEYKNYKQNQKFYLVYNNKIVLCGKTLYSVKKSDLIQMSFMNLNMQNSFNDIKNSYLSAVNADNFNIYNNFIFRMIKFANSIKNNIYIRSNSPSDQYQYVNLSSFNCVKKKVNTILKLIILQGCNFE